MRRGFQIVLTLIIIFLLYYIGFDIIGKTAGTIVSIVATLIIISIGFGIFMENRNPSSTLAWFLLFALLPVGGLILYFLFGQDYIKRRKYDKKAMRDQGSYEMIQKQAMIYNHDLSKFTADQQKLLKLSQRVARTPVSFTTRTHILTNGEETFSALLDALEQAQHHIHMEYYIFRADDIGTRIQQVLIEKAKAGVKVRFMYDAVGSLTLPKSFVQQLKDAGVEVVAFGMAKLLVLLSRVNYRNHRKIVVVDGKVAFMGGLNVGDEYLSRSKTYGFWRDTHMKLTGEGVRTLQMIFLKDWLYMTREKILEPIYFSPTIENVHDGAVQIIASGPDNERPALKNIFFSMITSAKKSVWFATPYFIPDDDILSALRVAALSGIDVRILFPAKPDKWTPYLASHSYFPSLLEVGVKIYEYEKGFLHSKLLIIDGEVATVGTANMDMRSFHLNFEVNALLIGTASVQKMVADFKRDLLNTRLINPKEYRNKKLVKRLLESGARLLSPLL
ncbi:cardiolipin synthase [Paenibacillus sediminis]|uniref:Cardiolipin synthase n=1 Tax=Paenibacillus sediminis TaxID=664909 RepID=A0ABS4H2G6_9BACL|nr:cardiolipin synthase [Paenibacillus sediminis]MBP1936729.1 cardiolipin synthase [Paenibacillus sediminis]